MILRLLLLSLTLWAGVTSAQQATPYQVPRTFIGQPDLEGMWHTEFVTMLERLPGSDNLVLDEAQAAELSAQILSFIPHNEDPDFEWSGVDAVLKVRGELRSSIIVEPADGHMPYLDSALSQVNYYANRYEEEFDHPEQRPLGERCLGTFAGPPIHAIPLMFPYKIVQTEDDFLLWAEGPVGSRIVHLNSERGQAIQSAHEGYSTGYWDGDTLVVTTNHFRGDHSQRSGFGRPMLIGPNTTIVERFSRASATELNYYFTVSDDTLYSQPWSGEFSLYRHEGPMYEYACHEGNYSLPGILLGGQLQAMEAEAGL